jgi:hypothetical protein
VRILWEQELGLIVIGTVDDMHAFKKGFDSSGVGTSSRRRHFREYMPDPFLIRQRCCGVLPGGI